MTQKDYIALVNQAQRKSYEYYVLSAPTISDTEFDVLVAEIEKAESEHPEWIVPDSPTQCVGSDLSANGRRQIIHRTPMLSCQKAKNLDELAKWVSKSEQRMNELTHSNHTGGYNYVLMWKYDGISCSIVYQDGELVSASTRGDGRVGQDITEHVKMMGSVPQQLSKIYYGEGFSLKGRIEVRGEICCSKKNLPLLSQKYTDCRTAASSLCNQAVPDEYDMAMLDFIPWDAIIDEQISCQRYLCPTPLGYPWHKLSFLENLGFVHRAETFSPHGYEACAACIAEREKERDAYPWPVDGVVIRITHDDYFQMFGATEHHPHGSIAYKFAPAKTITRCTRIEVTVGKTGKRTPVVHFEPVTIMGRTVRKASVGSEATLQRLGVVMGSTIEVGLANDVRPTVYRVIEDAENQAPEVTENDPLEGIDFPGEESPVCSSIFAASEEEQPEEPWLAPSFADLYPETQVLHEAPTPPVVEPAAVPVSEDDGQQSPGGSVAAPNGKHKILAAVTTLCVALAVVCGAAVLLGALAFALPVLNGTLRA